jgi:hypothetical protein
MWLGRGVLATLDGEPDVGKSTLAADLAARVSRGFAAPGSDGPRAEPAGVLLLSAQESAATVLRPRLEAAGADLQRVRICSGSAELVKDLDAVRATIQRHQVALMVIDPLQAFLNRGLRLDNEQHVRQTVGPLQELAADTGACVLLVRRPTKMRQTSALYRGAGCLAVLEACWTALVVGRDPGGPHRRILALTKGKAGLPPPSLGFTLEPRDGAAAVAWQGECAWTADEVVAPVTDQKVEKMSRVEDCAQYIRGLLRPGTMPANDLSALCELAGFADITVQRARKVLGVRAVRTSLCTWEVALPAAPAETAPTTRRS